MNIENKELDTEKLTGISALFIYAAKIDGNYTNKEKKIISQFLKLFSKDEEIIKKILEKAENLENDSNQILDFVNIIKKNSLESKSIVIKELWKIVLSDNVSNEYESNLMRRICGLIYFPDKLSGKIKIEIMMNKK